MKAVIWTDIVQFCILTIGLPLTLYFGIQHAGGIAAIRDAIPAGHLQLPDQPLALISLASLFLTFLLGETLVPPYLQRLMIGRNIKETSRGTLYSGLFFHSILCHYRPDRYCCTGAGSVA